MGFTVAIGDRILGVTTADPITPDKQKTIQRVVKARTFFHLPTTMTVQGSDGNYVSGVARSLERDINFSAGDNLGSTAKDIPNRSGVSDTTVVVFQRR
jgi:hypothetical protein